MANGKRTSNDVDNNNIVIAEPTAALLTAEQTLLSTRNSTMGIFTSTEEVAAAPSSSITPRGVSGRPGNVADFG